MFANILGLILSATLDDIFKLPGNTYTVTRITANAITVYAD
jgi:hypothetical protein